MMKLSPGERSILAYFPSSEKAQKAADELNQAGFGETQIDRVSRHGVINNSRRNNPLNRAKTLTGLTLYSGRNSGEALSDAGRILLAADASASGFGDHNSGVAGGHAFLLTLVTTEDKVNEAVEILQRNSGEV